MARLAAILLVTLTASACGTSHSGDPSKPAGPSADFVALAESICGDLEEALVAERPPTDKEMRRLVEQWDRGLDELAALNAPPDRKPGFRRMIVHYRTMAGALEEMAAVEGETVLAAAVGMFVEGQAGSRAARKIGLDACAFFPEIEQPPADPQPIYDAARDVLPPNASIHRADDERCSQDDSCHFEFQAGGTARERLRGAHAALRAQGWTSIRSGRAATGSSWLMANRNDLQVTVQVVGERLPQHCSKPTDWECSDSVWVHRVEVPDLVTGG